MKRSPKVSFIIRTKNEAKFIGKVLKCIFRQTYKNFEVIIIDSGSTDKTVEIVKKFPIKLIEIKQSEFGMSYAINLAATRSRGKILCILSGHSIPITDTWLADGVKFFRNRKVAGITGYYSENAVGYVFRQIWRLDFWFHKTVKNYSPWITNTNSLIRKDLWKLYPFDEKLPGSEDYDWGKEMLARGYNIIVAKKFSVFHSHYLLGRPGYFERLPIWKKRNKIIESRKRPRKSYTKIKV